ncbi:SGNH hydrolase [Pluteus cervinus]|uniref:SGNH hydrolase n=1 Tax=Pluteus cervinus TaxID=181527 RepID=A0ACD3AU38_9AGAR|nr:SGNH hydrolase [Pluteus cervinus]
MALVAAVPQPTNPATLTKVIPNDHPLIYYHGRWDEGPGTWWTGSGFKLNIQNLRSLSIQLGPHTTSPYAAIGVSIGEEEFVTINATAGVNEISLSGTGLQLTEDDLSPEEKKRTTVVRINVEGWQDNRIQLEHIAVNRDAVLLPYKPNKLVFQFIGDSLSAVSGQYLPAGVNQAWPFLVGEYFKAEHRVNAQPGATLSDMESYGNVHGVSYQFFQTEDTGFYYTSDHNFTTPWEFTREEPAPTHIVIHVGANDASHSVSNEDFIKVYNDFLTRLRKIYRRQPVFIFTPWGWPNANGDISYYYDGQYQALVNQRHASGDKNVFLVDTTGWVTFDDVFPDNTHPNVPGHAKIANLFEGWLEDWGLKRSEH